MGSIALLGGAMEFLLIIIAEKNRYAVYSRHVCFFLYF